MPTPQSFTARQRPTAWVHALVVIAGLASPAWAAPEELSAPSPETAEGAFAPSRIILLRGTVFHVQGLDLDAEFIYVTSVNKKTHRGYLHKFTRAGDLVRVVDLTDGPRYHAGGISLDDETLWVPVAEARAGSSARVVRLDKHTLEPVSSFAVADHIGAVAVRGDRLYGANWRTTSFHVWDRAGKPVAIAASPTQVHYQDIKVVGDDLVASGLMPDGRSGAIDWLDPDTLAPRRRLSFGKMSNGLLWTQEGMALQGKTLYLLPNDGGKEGVEIYAFDLLNMDVVASACMISAVNRCLLDRRSLASR